MGWALSTDAHAAERAWRRRRRDGQRSERSVYT